jgi:maltooligosyltrehalose trehalohydrolase
VARLARCLAEGFAYQGEPSPHRDGEPRGEPSAHLPPSAFVAFLQNHDQIGNRAFGERLTELAPPDRLALARAALLLGPQIPMLYMGEEWGSTTPFLYFVDFEDEDLARAVRDGRRREFARFKSFSEQHDAEEIPDPTLEDTYDRSRLDWDDLAKAPYRDVLSETTRLLQLRATAVVPLTKSRFLGASFSQPDQQAFDIVWRFEDGTLRFLANFGEADFKTAVNETVRTIWKSDAASFDGRQARLPQWTGLFVTDALS